MSQGKLKVINHGIQSENIQTMTGKKRAADNVPKYESKKLPKKDPKKDSKQDSKKDSEKAKEDTVQLESSMLVNDARKEDSIIDCDNLLEQFEAINDNSMLRNQVHQNSNKNVLDFHIRTLCGHPLGINQYDLDSLKGSNWVTEGVVEYYLDILHRNMDIRAQKDVHILSCAVFPTLHNRFKKGNGNARLLNIAENIFDKNLVILPICHNGHWIIAVASRLKQITEPIDAF